MNRFAMLIQEAEEQLSSDKELTIGDLDLDSVAAEDPTNETPSEETTPEATPENVPEETPEPTPEQPMDVSIEVTGEIPEEGSFDQYKKEDLTENRGPIEQPPTEPEPTATETEEDLPGYLENRMTPEDLNRYKETENMDPNDVTLGSFGSDQSDVHNDYDPKDVETLMKLMASEADALSEYLEAAKVTNTDVLRRLYADIGNEERFHMEQLLFAKSELTGEKYEPKDSEVKAEYEELLSMGMDEETAMQTAVDKLHIRGFSVPETNEEFTQGMNEINNNIASLTESFKLLELVSDMVLESYFNDDYKRGDMDQAVCEYLMKMNEDDDVMMEAVATAEKHYDWATSLNPFKIIGEIIGVALRIAYELINACRRILNKCKNRTKNAAEFIKTYGVEGIFKQGIYLYFEPETDHLPIELDKWFTMTAAATAAMQQRAARMGVRGGHNFSNMQGREGYGAMYSRYSANVNTIVNDMEKLDVIKSKVPMPHNPADREAMFEYLVGYDNNIERKSKNYRGRSRNIINDLIAWLGNWNNLLKYLQDFTKAMKSAGETNPSLAQTRDFKSLSRALKASVVSCNKFCKCLSHDITQINNVCQRVYRITESTDKNDILKMSHEDRVRIDREDMDASRGMRAAKGRR